MTPITIKAPGLDILLFDATLVLKVTLLFKTQHFDYNHI